ncbi:MFS transporter [Burkholderia glumae]|uniref:MFS transporter n=6 Tax=Burkholderia glumae TaxID=337 RepID=A0AAP9XYA4_BURGL|nr:MFS transporter [Burkholderia glumae]ACR31296.1 major facilitator superfamily MFS_1 [Burkholderia glumae BGR1]AJY64334.1 major Facilitator Superfamily protein [Burkholderia glumae LMG 2196 = ATCC 33617]MCM2493724.1 MFS transporter [Burkholderia glumae]MCM2541127.1 MFS transporter [Burkholderia glumae]MCM2546919.1 MFS transporter [Burkholderia glumae]
MTDSVSPEAGRAPATRLDAGRPWMLYLMFGLYGVQQGMLGPAMPFVRAELGLDLRAVGLHFAAYALGLVAIGLPYRWLTRRRLPTGLGQIAILSIVVSSGLFSLARALPVTLLAAVAMGLSGGLVLAIGQAKLGARYREQAAARLVEAHVVAGLCVLGGALLIGAATSAGASWRVAPVLVALIAVALAAWPVPAYRRDEAALHAGPGAPGQPAAGAAARAPRALLVSLWALVILGISGEWGVGFWGAEFLKDTVAGNASAAATLMSVYFGGTVAGRLASSALLRRLHPLTLLAAVALGAIAVFCALHATRDLAVTTALTALLGACLGNFFPLILGAAMRAAPDAGPTLSARASQAVGVALLVAPFLLGMLSEHIGMRAAFSLLVACPLLMLPFLPGLREPRPRTAHYQASEGVSPK